MSPAMSVSQRRILNGIMLLALAGIAVSSVSLYHHYDTSGASFCDFGGNFNCDIVNRSIYSKVFEVPVALIGILGYVVLLILAQLSRKKTERKTFLLIAAILGFVFALRLTYIEGFVLAAWCALCLSSLAIISLITILAIISVVSSRQRI
jgi:uncharacterized membrane protein